jgi:hypothetical protein
VAVGFERAAVGFESAATTFDREINDLADIPLQDLI